MKVQVRRSVARVRSARGSDGDDGDPEQHGGHSAEARIIPIVTARGQVVPSWRSEHVAYGPSPAHSSDEQGLISSRSRLLLAHDAVSALGNNILSKKRD